MSFLCLQALRVNCPLTAYSVARIAGTIETAVAGNASSPSRFFSFIHKFQSLSTPLTIRTPTSSCKINSHSEILPSDQTQRFYVFAIQILYAFLPLPYRASQKTGHNSPPMGVLAPGDFNQSTFFVNLIFLQLRTKGLAVCSQCLCNLASAIRASHSIIFLVNASSFLSAKAFPVYLFLCANSPILYSLKSSQSGITS